MHEVKHCEHSKIVSEVTEDGKTIFIRIVFDDPLCCVDCLRRQVAVFMASLDFNVDRQEDQSLH